MHAITTSEVLYYKVSIYRAHIYRTAQQLQ